MLVTKAYWLPEVQSGGTPEEKESQKGEVQKRIIPMSQMQTRMQSRIRIRSRSRSGVGYVVD